MLRYSCLIIGILVALLFLATLITCRLSGRPFAEESSPTWGEPDTSRNASLGTALELNGVGQVVDALRLMAPTTVFSPARFDVDANEVYPPVGFSFGPVLQVVLTGRHQPAHLGTGEGFFGYNEAIGMTSPDLDEHQFLALLSHDIHFSVGTAVVGSQNAVPVVFKEPAGLLLSPGSQSGAWSRHFNLDPEYGPPP